MGGRIDRPHEVVLESHLLLFEPYKIEIRDAVVELQDLRCESEAL